MGVSLGGLAGLGSLAGGALGLLGHGAQAPQQQQLPGMTSAAMNVLGGVGNLGGYNTYGATLPQVGQITGGLVHNPYASGYQQGANVAGGLGQLQALGQYGTGQQLQGAGNTVMQTAFDPQQQLYSQQMALTQAQQNAANAGAGVGTSPYGAGLQDQNIQNFNIAWQNQQLQRQLSGLQGYGAATQQAQGLMASAPGQYLQSSAIPYGTYGAIGQGQIGALGALGQYGQMASQIPQQQLQDYLSYIGAGTAQQGANNQTAALQAAMQNMYMGQLGAGLSGLGNAYTGMGGQPLLGSGSAGGVSFPIGYQGNPNLPAD